MILLSPSAIVAAQMDHFVAQPTHAQLVHTQKANVPDDPELASIAPDLNQKIAGTYIYGTLNGQTGAFVRMPHTPIVHVLLNTTTPTPTTDVPTLAPFIPDPNVSNEVNAQNQANYDTVYATMQRQNRATMAVGHIMNPGVAPNPSQPWMPSSTPAKKAWHYTDADFDAVATIHEPKLAGTVV